MQPISGKRAISPNGEIIPKGETPQSHPVSPKPLVRLLTIVAPLA